MQVKRGVCDVLVDVMGGASSKFGIPSCFTKVDLLLKAAKQGSRSLGS
jgi:hypothetical protein